MPIELAGIQLNRVHKVTTLEQAAFVYHRIPGLEGNVVQDLGRDSVRLQVEGIFYGGKAKEDLETLRKVYKKREAVDFLAEVVGQAYFGQVTLERFEVAQVAGAPEQFSYLLVVTEYVEPPPTAAAGASAVNTAVSLEAQAFMDIASLPDLLQMGQIPELTNPAEPMSGALDQVTTASGGVSAIAESIGALFQLKVEPTPEGAKLPDGWGQPPELTWGSPPPLPSTAVSPPQLFGANGELLGADGKPLTGPNGELLGADGKPLPTDWLVIELKDEMGTAVPDIAYTLTLPDGTTLQGTLDTQGQSHIQNLPSGNLQLTFPDLDMGDWLAPSAPDGEQPGGDPSAGDGGAGSGDKPTDGETAEPPTGEGDTPTTTGWLAIELVDENGRFVANMPYQITLTDGTTRQGTLDATGRATEANLPDGDLQLTFPNLDASEWADATSPVVEPSGDEPLGKGGKGDTAPTAKTGWLAIELVDENGRFAANIPYQITLIDGTTRQGTLDATGRATEANLPDGDLQLTFPNLDASEWADATSLEPSGDEPLGEGDKGDTAPTAKTGWLAIELVDENGRFAANIPYQITLTDGTTRQGTLDATGRATETNLPGGDLQLTFPNLDASEWADATSLEPSGDEPLGKGDKGDTAPTAKTGWLAIELVDENGRFAANMPYQITLTDGTTRQGTLDATGRATETNLPSGDLQLTFPDLDMGDWLAPSAPDGEQPGGDPSAGDGGAGSGGKPTDGETAEPPTGEGDTPTTTGWLAIELADENGRFAANMPYQITLTDGTTRQGALDATGRATEANLPGGDLQLTFPNLDASEWADATSPVVEPSGDEPSKEGEPLGEGDKGDTAPTAKTSWLAIELVDENGRFAANMPYQITLTDGTTQTGALDNQGQVRIEGLAPGDYTLTFPDLDAEDWAIAGKPAPPEPAPSPQKTNWLFIELADKNNKPVPGLRYTFTTPDGITHEGILNEQGQVRLEGLSDGNVQISFPQLDGQDWANQSFESTSAKGWLTIELRAESGTAVPNIRYVLTLADGTVYEGNLDEHGLARIENLELGSYTLTFPDLDGDDWLNT